MWVWCKSSQGVWTALQSAAAPFPRDCIWVMIFCLDSTGNILFEIPSMLLPQGAGCNVYIFPSDPSGSCIPLNTWMFHIMQSVLCKGLG